MPVLTYPHVALEDLANVLQHEKDFNQNAHLIKQLNFLLCIEDMKRKHVENVNDVVELNNLLSDVLCTGGSSQVIQTFLTTTI
jgi:hypothetical protein